MLTLWLCRKSNFSSLVEQLLTLITNYITVFVTVSWYNFFVFKYIHTWTYFWLNNKAINYLNDVSYLLKKSIKFPYYHGKNQIN